MRAGAMRPTLALSLAAATPTRSIGPTLGPETTEAAAVASLADESMGLSTIASRLSVSSEQVDQLNGLRAVHADTWVHAIVTLRAPWSGESVSFEDALQWVSTARGNQRGWTIRFEDGSKLVCTRRYDAKASATFTPADAPGAAEPSLRVRIGGQTVECGFEVRPGPERPEPDSDTLLADTRPRDTL